MKKLIITVLVLFLVYAPQAQTGSAADTAIYLKKIELRKADFIGRPFSALLDSLKIQIKAFDPLAEITSDKNKETSTVFCFIIPKSLEDYKYPSLKIYWEPFLDHKRANEIFDNTEEGGVWNNESLQFYSTGIIKDIKAN